MGTKIHVLPNGLKCLRFLTFYNGILQKKPPKVRF